jgi:serine/threonine-protein kinase HipA
VLEKGSQHVFTYDTADQAAAVSLTMPQRRASYASTPMLPAFTMNRPEGFLLERLQRAFKHVLLDDMALLAITGENQIGRLRYREEATTRRRGAPQIGLRQVLANGNRGELFEHLVETYLEMGISGYQPKIMIPDADRMPESPARAAAPAAEPLDEKTTFTTPTLIIKAAGDEYPHLAANEFLCMEAARRAGLPVPKFWLSDDRALFVMERFDLDEERQLGFEDMAVLMGRDPSVTNFKYASSYETIAKVIAANCAENTDVSLKHFFAYVALSVMVHNGDAHLKNFGLLYDHPAGAAPLLSPVFDVVTTSVYPYENQRTGRPTFDRTLALKLDKSLSYPTRETLLEFGRSTCHVPNPEDVLDNIADAMTDTLAEHHDLMPTAFEIQFRAEWDAGRLAVGERIDYPMEITSSSRPAGEQG